MKVTKYTHSCVVIEHDNKAVLFDPGIYSWQSGLVDVSLLPKLDTIIITHKHGDHMAEPFIKALVTRYPDVQWIAPTDAHADLQAWGVSKVKNTSDNNIDITEGSHAPVEPFGIQVNNLVVHWCDAITMPGDTHDITTSKEVLLLPMQAPWGTTVRALQLALQIKPKYVLPIHDWMWNETWRQTCYERFNSILAQNNITFLSPKDGETITIEV